LTEIVECRSDSQYAERPLALTWQGERLEITEILARWRSPAGVGFQVQVKSGALFELFYDEADDRWHIEQK
jgi:hypothetical protein